MITVRNKKWLEKYLGIKIVPDTQIQDLLILLAKKVQKLEHPLLRVKKRKIEVLHGAPNSEQLSNPATPGKGGVK